jgi:hypothetical protein
MSAEQQTSPEIQQFKPLYFVALLESQNLARQALRRLESLYQRFPDPSLLEAIEALRRADDRDP